MEGGTQKLASSIGALETAYIILFCSAATRNCLLIVSYREKREGHLVSLSGGLQNQMVSQEFVVLFDLLRNSWF